MREMLEILFHTAHNLLELAKRSILRNKMVEAKCSMLRAKILLKKSLSRNTAAPSARDPPGVSRFARAARPKGYARETQLAIEIRGLASSHKERDEMGQK